MRKLIAAAATVSVLAVTVATPSFALPPVGFNLAPRENVESPVDQTRIFCYNRYTGRFKHWGPCGGYAPAYYRAPRVYCRNRYTGAFLHWGSCW